MDDVCTAVYTTLLLLLQQQQLLYVCIVQTLLYTVCIAFVHYTTTTICPITYDLYPMVCVYRQYLPSTWVSALSPCTLPRIITVMLLWCSLLSVHTVL